MDALVPPEAERAADAGAPADCPVLAEDARQSALGAALALHAALCGARCPPLKHPDNPGSSGPAAAAPAGPAPPIEEDVAPGAEAGLQSAAEASPAAAPGAAGFPGAAALLARAAEAVPLLLDAASEQQVVCLQALRGGLPTLWGIPRYCRSGHVAPEQRAEQHGSVSHCDAQPRT